MRRLARILAVPACAAALGAAALPAFGGLSVQAVPIKHQVTVRPGELAARDVVVSNVGPSPVVVCVRLADWRLDAGGEMELLDPGTTPETLEGAVAWEPREFSLQPGESGRVQVTLNLPAGGPATRWGVLLSEVRATDAAPVRFRPRTVAQLGTTIYLSRVPENSIRPEVTALRVVPRGGDSLEVAVTVRNAGERHFYIAGGVALADSAGTRLAEGPLGTGVVLPGGSRTFARALRCPPAAGRWVASATLDTGEPELLVVETSFAWPASAEPSPPVAQDLRH